MTINELLAAYRLTAIAHGEALEAGDARRCNAAHGELEDIRTRARYFGQDWQGGILALLGDDRPAVRNCAAVDALDFSPEDGLRALREVASGPRGVVQLDARMILESWESGEWQGET